jgi:hypothetical protein
VPTPQVDFEALSGRIRNAVAEQNEPIQSYRLHWVRTASALALAACVVIAVGLGIRRMQAPPMNNNQASNTRPQPQAKQIVVIDATTRPTVSSAPVAIVSVGPSASAAGPAGAGALSRRPPLPAVAGDHCPRRYAAQDAPTQDGILFP